MLTEDLLVGSGVSNKQYIAIEMVETLDVAAHSQCEENENLVLCKVLVLVQIYGDFSRSTTAV